MQEEFLSSLTNEQLKTIGNFIVWDLKSDPHKCESRKNIVSKILLELEKRQEIDRLDAAAAHKSLQNNSFSKILVFYPDPNSIANEKINDFLKNNMKNFGIVIHWTKRRFNRSK